MDLSSLIFTISLLRKKGSMHTKDIPNNHAQYDHNTWDTILITKVKQSKTWRTHAQQHDTNAPPIPLGEGNSYKTHTQAPD